MVLVGYHPTGAYKLYDPAKDKMVINRDVVILEDEIWDWKQGQTNLKRVLMVSETSDTIAGENADSAESGAERDITQSADRDIAQRRPRRQSTRPPKLSDYELYANTGVSDKGDLVHMALMARIEQIDVDKAMAEIVWKEAMIEELKSIKKNKT